MTYLEFYQAWSLAQELIRIRDKTQAQLASTPWCSPEERQALKDELADVVAQLNEQVPG